MVNFMVCIQYFATIKKKSEKEKKEGRKKGQKLNILANQAAYGPDLTFTFPNSTSIQIFLLCWGMLTSKTNRWIF